jgi:hypothetical protein
MTGKGSSSTTTEPLRPIDSRLCTTMMTDPQRTPPKGDILSRVLGIRIGILAVGLAFLLAEAARTQRLADQDVAGAHQLHRKLLLVVLVYVIDIAFVAGMLARKKWGAYGFVALSVVGTLVGIGEPGRMRTTLVVGVVCDLLILGFVSTRWSQFE